MVNGECRTSIDNCICPVKIFAGIPNKGDEVFVIKDQKQTTLKVYSIIHTQKAQVYGTLEPYIIVQLN